MFISIVDHITKRTYPLIDIPADYGPMPSYFFEARSAGPIHLPYEGETGRGRYCISHMIDMYEDKIPFTFIEPGDIIDVEKHLLFFLEYLQEVGSLSTQQNIYRNKTSRFYQAMQKSATRLKAQNPNKIFKPSIFLKMVERAEG